MTAAKMAMIAAALAIMLCASLMAWPVHNSGAPQSMSQSLSEAELRGQQIYLKGTSPSGSRIGALINSEGTEVPGSAFACANCHGKQGAGGSEGGVAPSNLTWSSLTRPYEVTSTSGRKHGAYDEGQLKRAIAMGLDPAGNRLLDAMPRFRLSLQDMDDLIAYVKRMGGHTDPGITDSTIVLGSVVPADGRVADMGHAVRSVVEAFFSEINSDGGVFGRKIELQFADGARQPELKGLLEGQHVFALVSPITAGSDKELAQMFEADEVPVVGPVSLAPDDNQSIKHHVFYLFSPLSDQVRTLFTYGAQDLKGSFSRIAVVCPDSGITSALPAVVEEQCKKLDVKLVAKLGYPEGQFNANQAALELRAANPDCVFVFGPSAEQQELANQLEKLHWTPNLMLLGSLAGKDMFDFGSTYGGKVFASYPTLPSDRSPEAMNRFIALAQKYKFPQGHLAAELSAYCACEVLLQALKLAGHDLTRSGLIDALETLYDFNTGLTPRITYGPNRHVGALGAYIVIVDQQKKQLVPVSGWLMPN
jgi:ABC-type branched-subunit amino acid transport system substrate-binding protein